MARNSWQATQPLKENISSGLIPRHLTKQEFGKRLYSMMIKKGWSQSELSRQADIGRDSVSTYVRGISFPDPQNVEKLCTALGVTREELLPNTAESAMDREHPAIEIRMAHDDPEKVWLRVNRMCSTATAAKIFELLQQDK